MKIINLDLVSIPKIGGYFFSVVSRSLRLSVRNSRSRLDVRDWIGEILILVSRLKNDCRWPLFYTNCMRSLATMLILHAHDGLGFVEPLRKVKYTPASKKKRHRPRRTIGGKSVASKYEGGVCGCAPSKKPNPFFVASALKKRPRNSLI